MVATDTRKKTGRPATGVGDPITVRLHEKALALLDEWRRQQPDLPSRPEALRRLAELGRERQAKLGKKKD
jgi:hypothetical protein